MLLRAVFRTLGLLPRRSLEKLARALGLLWHLVDRRHRELARRNVAWAYRVSPRSVFARRVVRENFMHLATVALELPVLCFYDPRKIARDVDIKGGEYLRRSMGTTRGFLLITGHIGNWEILAFAASLHLGLPIHVMARTLDFAPLNGIVQKMRTLTGNVVLEKNHAAIKVAALLRNGKCVGILMDQNASWYDGVYAPLFGRTACTSKGVALLAIRSGADVLPVFCRRMSNGRYLVEFEAPVPLSLSGDLKKDVLVNTARFNAVIERAVRRAPEQWLWVHRRWNLKDIPEEVRKKQDALPGMEEIEENRRFFKVAG